MFSFNEYSKRATKPLSSKNGEYNWIGMHINHSKISSTVQIKMCNLCSIFQIRLFRHHILTSYINVGRQKRDNARAYIVRPT